MPTLITNTEWLEINGVPLATPGWHVPAGGLLSMLQGPDVVGGDRRLPRGRSRRYQRHPSLGRRVIPLTIFAFEDHEGTPHADPAIGRTANIDYLRANVSDPTETGDGTVTAVLHLKDGSTRTGAVTVESLELGGDAENAAVLAVLTITIDKALELDGS